MRLVQPSHSIVLTLQRSIQKVFRAKQIPKVLRFPSLMFDAEDGLCGPLLPRWKGAVEEAIENRGSAKKYQMKSVLSSSIFQFPNYPLLPRYSQERQKQTHRMFALLKFFFSLCYSVFEKLFFHREILCAQLLCGIQRK